MALTDNLPKNAESRSIAITCKLIKKYAPDVDKLSVEVFEGRVALKNLFAILKYIRKDHILDTIIKLDGKRGF